MRWATTITGFGSVAPYGGVMKSLTTVEAVSIKELTGFVCMKLGESESNARKSCNELKSAEHFAKLCALVKTALRLTFDIVI